MASGVVQGACRTLIAVAFLLTLTVRLRVREQLALGASQVKLMAGGGVSSNYDPLDVTQYTVAELRAAVEAVSN